MLTRLPLLLLLSAGLLAPLPAALAQDATPSPAAAEAKRFVDEKAPAVVTIKYLLKHEEGEQEMEVPGLVIDPSGLILASNINMGGMTPAMARAVGGSPPTPAEIKILIGDDNEGLEAKVIARDSELDLAWLRLKDPPKSPLASVDLAHPAAIGLGDRVIGLERLGKFFDRAPMLREDRIGAVLSKPRTLYLPASLLLTGFGVPVFDSAGNIAGVSIFLPPDAEDMEGEGGGYGDRRSANFIRRGLILPTAEVASATRRALETAAADDAPAAAPSPAADSPK